MRSLFFTPKPEDVPEEPVSDRQPKENRGDSTPDKHIKARRTKNVHFDRRIKSELHLEECLPWHFEKGASYHCISHGDVDSLTYLRVIVKQQPVEYVLISTWCMAITDVKEVEKWLERKDIGCADFYVGEIFQGSYADVYLYLKKVAERFGSRVCIFRNQQTCITIDTGLARFYKEFYDEINNFTKDFDNWKPYTLKRDRANDEVI